MYVNVVFVIRCLYSAVSLTLVKEQRFIRIILLLLVSGSCHLLFFSESWLAHLFLELYRSFTMYEFGG